MIITEAAKQQFETVLQDAGEGYAGIRVTAQKVGHHTFRYHMQLVKQQDEQRAPDDVVMDIGKFRAYLDAKTDEWMKGATIDYVNDDTGSGFDISNPASKIIWDNPIAQKVQKVLDEQITPGLSAHGGWAELVEIQGDTAIIQLGGGCHGCSGAHSTMQYGVEAVIKKEVPEIAHVTDGTDHACGEEPYL